MPATLISHSVELLESTTDAPVRVEVRLVLYEYVHGDTEHVAATLRTLRTTSAFVVLVDVAAAAPVTQLTCDTFVANTAQRTPPIVTSMSPRRSESPSPYRVTTVPPATEPPAEVSHLLHFLALFARHAAVEVPGLELYQMAVGQGSVMP